MYQWYLRGYKCLWGGGNGVERIWKLIENGRYKKVHRID